LENGDFTGNLLGEIERLRYSPAGLPVDDYVEFAPDFIQYLAATTILFVTQAEKQFP
jgi:hypothetical protein